MRQRTRRLLWFAGLWLGSLAAFGALAYGARWAFLGLGRLTGAG
ncbi:MAG: DUF2474 domain-containing protein [Alphaproteobacteria bacterium]|nr:DUF2474 domain-containing protein [Alphaproteobacteria bacterium]